MEILIRGTFGEGKSMAVKVICDAFLEKGITVKTTQEEYNEMILVSEEIQKKKINVFVREQKTGVFDPISISTEQIAKKPRSHHENGI